MFYKRKYTVHTNKITACKDERCPQPVEVPCPLRQDHPLLHPCGFNPPPPRDLILHYFPFSSSRTVGDIFGVDALVLDGHQKPSTHRFLARKRILYCSPENRKQYSWKANLKSSPNSLKLCILVVYSR
jgi:hypothetical protein